MWQEVNSVRERKVIAFNETMKSIYKKVETEPKKKEQDSPEALFASIGDASQERIDSEDSHVQDDRLDQVPVTEFNKALSTDAIEEMLASMGTSPIAENLMPEEENLQEESEDWESFDLKEWSPEEEILSVDSEEEESLALEEWDVEEDCLPEVADEPEEAELEEWALEEENLMEESFPADSGRGLQLQGHW